MSGPRAATMHQRSLVVAIAIAVRLVQSTDGSTDLPHECQMPGDQYKSSGICSPAVREAWSKQLAVPKQENACAFDYNSGKIVCDTEFNCEGGKHHYEDRVYTRNAMSFDCSECHDIHKESCCNKCREIAELAASGGLTINHKPMHEVTCEQCDRNPGSHKQHEIRCNHNPTDGSFRCRLSEHCEVGRSKFLTQNLSYACTVTPCDSCTTPFSRAQCCVSCLNNYCNHPLSFDDRRVCKGCDIDTPIHAPAPSRAWSTPVEPAIPPPPQRPPPPQHRQISYGMPPEPQLGSDDYQWHYGWKR